MQEKDSEKICPMCNGLGVVRCSECRGRGRPFDCDKCTNFKEVRFKFDFPDNPLRRKRFGIDFPEWGYEICIRCKGKGKTKRA
jgi:hypothetical protein